MKKTKSGASRVSDVARERSARKRILGAAFTAFTENGYAGTSTLEIATRAKVSKRELYTLFGNKQAMLVACVAGRTTRTRFPPDLPAVRDFETFAKALSTFGAILLREVSHPAVIAVFRLAIAEATRSPEVAQVLDLEGRRPSSDALTEIMTQAQAAGLLEPGDPTEMAAQFHALLWGDLMVGLLLRVAKPLSPPKIERRALNAANAFLKLYSKPQTPANFR